MKYNDYSVSEQTCIINRIKNNNKTVELLESIEKAMDEIYYNCDSNLLYKDNDGNYISTCSGIPDRDFYNNLCEWVMKNCLHLVKDSKEQYAKMQNNN